MKNRRGERGVRLKSHQSSRFGKRSPIRLRSFRMPAAYQAGTPLAALRSPQYHRNPVQLWFNIDKSTDFSTKSVQQLHHVPSLLQHPGRDDGSTRQATRHMCPPEEELNPLRSTSFCALESSSDRTPKRTPRFFAPDMSTLYEDRITMA